MSRCYVGGLPPDPTESSLFELFEPAGKILDVQIRKTISNDWYAFLHFEEPDGADEAVRRFDGSDFNGSRIRVELPFGARGHTKRAPRRPPLGPNHVSVRVYSIPPSGSWQDLKDHFREAGDCLYADVYGDGSGVVEYSNYDDAQRAVQMFDGSTFRSHQGESSRIRLEMISGQRSSSYRSRPYDGRYIDERRVHHYPSERGYGPIRPSYDRRGSYGRSRSPPRRRYHIRASPPPGAPSGDERYTTQDSRSTEAYSSTRNSSRRPLSPKRGDPHHQSSWSAGGLAPVEEPKDW